MIRQPARHRIVTSMRSLGALLRASYEHSSILTPFLKKRAGTVAAKSEVGEGGDELTLTPFQFSRLLETGLGQGNRIWNFLDSQIESGASISCRQGRIRTHRGWVWTRKCRRGPPNWPQVGPVGGPKFQMRLPWGLGSHDRPIST